jgi:hypothetical protein
MAIRLVTVFSLGVCLYACGSTAPVGSASPSSASATIDVSWSDPAEYRIEHATEKEGEAIFERTGIGDPYRTGLPYPIFLALLEMHPELLGATPQALAERFGFTLRRVVSDSADRDESEGLPLGLHLTDDPNTHVPFVVHNCALCHSEVVRWQGGEKLVVGLGNRRIRVHAFEVALAKVAAAPDFDRERILAVATRLAQQRGITWPSQYRSTIVSQTIRGVRERYTPRARLLERVAVGLPGRVATIESFAAALGQLLHRDVETSKAVGWARIPDTIGYGEKRTLSWDGGSEGPSDALVVDADIAAGARIEWLYKHPLQGASLSTFLRHAQRDLRFPGTIDAGLAAKGKPAFERACAKCHGTYEEDGRAKSYVEKIVPLDLLDTDPARALAVTDDFLAAANDPKLVVGGLRLVTTRRTSGYVPPVLTNIWARAPYGHAGQWPSLAVLATKPAQRPSFFVIHGEAPLDLERVGVATAAAGAPLGPGDYVQDGNVDGFRVSGHPFIADLGEDSSSVVEYLKTL